MHTAVLYSSHTPISSSYTQYYKVVPSYQVVDDGNDEVLSGAHGAIVVALEGPHRIVAVYCSLA